MTPSMLACRLLCLAAIIAFVIMRWKAEPRAIGFLLGAMLMAFIIGAQEVMEMHQ